MLNGGEILYVAFPFLLCNRGVHFFRRTMEGRKSGVFGKLLKSGSVIRGKLSVQRSFKRQRLQAWYF